MTSGLSGSPIDTAWRSRGRCVNSSFSSLASIRYSVGVWERIVTPSRCTSERRSWASNGPSCTTISAPCDQGPMREFQIPFAHPVSEVHQTTSPSCASSQCVACVRCAHVYACVCTTPFGSLSVPDV